MSRYRKIEVRTWTDQKFRELSPLLPSGQGLWFYLLTGPHTGPVPGLFRAGRAAMAEELNWSLDDFTDALDELTSCGMAKVDFGARLMWLPNALKHNLPQSPNVVRSWGVELDLLPECALKVKALARMREVLSEMGEPFVAALDEVLAKVVKASPKASPKPKSNQEQEQDQEQEQEQEQEQQDSAGDAHVSAITAADLSKMMCAEGVMAQPAHLLLIALAEQGVTPATIQAACKEARRTKGPTARISPDYVIAIIKRWKANGEDLQVDGVLAPSARASPRHGREAGRAAAAKSIGLGATYEPKHIIDIN